MNDVELRTLAEHAVATGGSLFAERIVELAQATLKLLEKRYCEAEIHVACSGCGEDEMIVNARIESTMLGVEDHGFTTFILHLHWEPASAQGYGGFALGLENKPSKALGHAIRRILETVGVDTWEQLKGKLVRIEYDNGPGKILRLGNILEERWLDLPAELKELEAVAEQIKIEHGRYPTVFEYQIAGYHAPMDCRFCDVVLEPKKKEEPDEAE